MFILGEVWELIYKFVKVDVFGDIGKSKWDKWRYINDVNDCGFRRE